MDRAKINLVKDRLKSMLSEVEEMPNYQSAFKHGFDLSVKLYKEANFTQGELFQAIYEIALETEFDKEPRRLHPKDLERMISESLQ